MYALGHINGVACAETAAIAVVATSKKVDSDGAWTRINALAPLDVSLTTVAPRDTTSFAELASGMSLNFWPTRYCANGAKASMATPFGHVKRPMSAKEYTMNSTCACEKGNVVALPLMYLYTAAKAACTSLFANCLATMALRGSVQYFL